MSLETFTKTIAMSTFGWQAVKIGFRSPRPDMTGHDAVVLLQMGGPARLEDVQPFLQSLFADPDLIQLPTPLRPLQPRLAQLIARRRTPGVLPRYAAIGDGKGGASPIGMWTARQARALSSRLALPVHVCMRYSAPRVEAVVAELAADHSRRVLLLPLYPHWSGSTTGSSVRDFVRAAGAARLAATASLVRSWESHPGYLDLLAATCLEATPTPAGAHLVLSAHSLPEKYALRGDPYPVQVQETARQVASRLAGAFASVRQGFQSAVGPVKWLGPQTGEHLQALAGEGARHVTLAPLGFVSDHIETLYDLDRLYTQQAQALGMEVRRARSFNDDPRFIEVLADLAQGPSAQVAPWTA